MAGLYNASQMQVTINIRINLFQSIEFLIVFTILHTDRVNATDRWTRNWFVETFCHVAVLYMTLISLSSIVTY